MARAPRMAGELPILANPGLAHQCGEAAFRNALAFYARSPRRTLWVVVSRGALAPAPPIDRSTEDGVVAENLNGASIFRCPDDIYGKPLARILAVPRTGADCQKSD